MHLKTFLVESCWRSNTRTFCPHLYRRDTHGTSRQGWEGATANLLTTKCLPMMTEISCQSLIMTHFCNNTSTKITFGLRFISQKTRNKLKIVRNNTTYFLTDVWPVNLNKSGLPVKGGLGRCGERASSGMRVNSEERSTYVISLLQHSRSLKLYYNHGEGP